MVNIMDPCYDCADGDECDRGNVIYCRETGKLQLYSDSAERRRINSMIANIFKKEETEEEEKEA
jgi:hypothetical protein